MAKIILQHGYGGLSTWFKWLQEECTSRGHDVHVPLLPTPREPVRSEWRHQIHEQYGTFEDAIIVAHSLGGYALVDYMGSNECTQTARGVITVASPARWNGRELTKDFYEPEPNWAQVKTHAKQFIIIHSTDDDTVPFDHADTYVQNLDGTLIAVDGHGHFDDLENQFVLDCVLKLL